MVAWPIFQAILPRAFQQSVRFDQAHHGGMEQEQKNRMSFLGVLRVSFHTGGALGFFLPATIPPNQEFLYQTLSMSTGK